MSAHTPGPWISTPDPCWHDEAMIGIEGSKPDHVACCALKDAALISAAPDMYDALTECICGLEVGLDAAQIVSTLGDGRCAAIRSALTQARAALAKAGGQ